MLASTKEKRYVLGLSGKDSLAAALLIKAFRPEIWEKLEVFTTLTGADYPETLTWLSSIHELLDKQVVLIDGDLPGLLEKYSSEDSAFLPSSQARWCTNKVKIRPFEKWLGDDEAILYTGIRADEQRIGYKESKRIRSEFPLVDFDFDLGRVWALILGLDEKYRPPTFYWPEIHELARQVWKQLLPAYGTELDDFLSYPQQVILMSGRSRPNCYFCFNQRRYEITWMREAHPDLFAQMMAYEKPGYSWIKDFPLSKLTQEKCDRLKWERATAIAKSVLAQSFSAEIDGFEKMPSCGLFCGK